MLDEKIVLAAKNSRLLADLAADLRKVASTGGGECAGSCPFCGGEDRFHVQPFNPLGPRWFCRHCTEGAWKDTIDFIIRRDGLSFRTAVEHLAGGIAVMPTSHAPAAAPSITQAPGPVWQERARAFAAECQDRLWSEAGRAALKSLRGRGFTDETIKQAGLGWNDETRYEDRAAWGLLPEMNDKGKPKRVWLPRGWVLPSHIDGDLWQISIRRPGDDVADDEQKGHSAGSKYVQLPGGANALFNSDAIKPGSNVVLVEGVFDALSIQQHAGDIVVPVATGSTTGARRVKWIARLALAELVLVAYDRDLNKAGDDAAEYWLRVLPNARRWRPWWDDPNRLAMDGVDLRDWLLPALPARLRQPALSNDPTVAIRNRLSDLLARSDLTPFQSREAQRLGDQLGVTVNIQRYDLNDPHRGWHELNEEAE